MAKAKSDGDDPITIKKYANRRLYNTGTSSYITLDDLAEMVRDDVEFQVVDAKSGEDITHSILTQIIMDEEANGEQMLPVSFLRDLIAMYGNSMQAMMPRYLEASMENFRKNREKLHEAFLEGMSNNPLAKIAETNMAMMRAATEAFIPKSTSSRPETKSVKDDGEIAALKKQMAAMQKKLDELDQ